MRQIDTYIEINASPAAIWAVLADFDAYPQWNPFIIQASGTPGHNEPLEISVRPPGGKAMAFRPRVINLEPQRELRWRGSLRVPGLFTGEHWFFLEPSASIGGTRFYHGEKFTGLLVPLLWRSLNTTTRAGFEAMNRALKARAEDRQAGAPG